VTRASSSSRSPVRRTLNNRRSSPPTAIANVHDSDMRASNRLHAKRRVAERQEDSKRRKLDISERGEPHPCEVQGCPLPPQSPRVTEVLCAINSTTTTSSTSPSCRSFIRVALGFSSGITGKLSELLFRQRLLHGFNANLDLSPPILVGTD